MTEENKEEQKEIKNEPKNAEKMEFRAEVGKVLDIVVNSLYSNADIFLRELISNASDACDKLRYMAVMHPEMTADEGGEFQIKIALDKKNNTLTISDNGIGMNKDDLINNLGTIAKSGSLEFLNNLDEHAKDASNLIGQFGVGFYSAFMAADSVEVRTRRAGEPKDQGWLWTSEGKGSFSISPLPDVSRGTSILLHLKKDFKEYTDAIKVRQIIRQYSDHISFPVMMEKDGKWEAVNSASALWTRNKAEITKEQYRDFYRHISHAFDEPWMTLHYKAEGAIEYTGLLFIPENAPFDLFQQDRIKSLKLYTNKVFISDDLPDFMPAYLRFVKGVIDTKDLPLNVSREMLQKTPVLAKVKKGLVRRLLSELKTRAKDAEDYNKFWVQLGKAFKEGIYEDVDNRVEIAELSRFYSTRSDKLISLDDYIAAMPEQQKSIYYITGEDLAVLRNSPQLEGFTARGLEVLLFTDPIDEFWTQAMPIYKDKPLKHISLADEEIKDIPVKSENKEAALPKDELDALISYMKIVLKDKVKDVLPTDRLAASPACLSAAKGDISLNLERMMKMHGQQLLHDSGRVLEINPSHTLVHKISDTLQHHKDEKESVLQDAITLLFEQASVAEGEPIKNPADFMGRITRFMIQAME
jgi:molecular chaperone HtpG